MENDPKEEQYVLRTKGNVLGAGKCSLSNLINQAVLEASLPATLSLGNVPC